MGSRRPPPRELHHPLIQHGVRDLQEPTDVRAIHIVPRRSELRRDVDATELDEVFLDEDEGEPPYGLPPLTTDEAGAPAADDEPKPDEEK